ncbi:hypothetical protein HYS31_04540 [Candidatus Woesearchaeota archaeon]|nr:hypothetical protein [Candidatus Woesearchaeota archaeon]
MARQNISFIVMNIVLFFVLMGFIFSIFDLHGLSFIFELGVLLALMFFLAFLMFSFYHRKRGSWLIIAGLLFLLLLNMLVVLILKRKFGIADIVTVFFSLLGIIIAVLNMALARSREPKREEDESRYYYPYMGKAEPAAEHRKIEPSVEKTFTPGKYVASRKANKFHSAKCDWAARISRENRVWFDSREEAQGKGFMADNCVA